MFTNEKGYSLSVLVITVAVMLILTMTAVVTLKNLTSDREVTNFMSDLQEVEQFVKEYYAKKRVIPARYENGVPVEITLNSEAQIQMSDIDNGKYYSVDLEKLGSLNLAKSDRGYVINEGSLKVYVTNPITYQGIKYYTLTDEILGINRVYGSGETFEIKVTGNPLTWSTGCKLLVSIPNVREVNDLWTFKYYRGGPITKEQFETVGVFFKYGDTIQVTENNIYSIYAENADGFAKVTNVVVDKIDDIEPYIYMTEDNNIVIRDDETGVSRVMYKIVNYDIPENVRAEDSETFFQGTPSHLPDNIHGGRWTYEEAYTGEKIDGITASIGRSINSYKSEYEEYLEMYNEYELLGYDLRSLDTQYPQFQYSGEPYSDDEQNIVLYVEDYAGNRSVTDRNNVMYKVSRKMLLESNFIDTIIKPLNGAKVVINENAEYTNTRKVSLELRAQGASMVYLSYDGEEDVSDIVWSPYFVSDYDLKDEQGEIELFAYFTANQLDDEGNLIYAVTSDKIYLDTNRPTTTAPQVDEIGYDMKLSVHKKQEDNESGIEKIIYGYKKFEDMEYTWVESTRNLILEPQTIYQIKTKATDKAGNTSESEVTEIKTPAAHTRTLPNSPAMATGMKAIIWDGTLQRPEDEIEINPNTWMTANGEKVTWYNYSLGSGIADSKDSIWANAKTLDGSYWVWIPRYAYKIIYYTSEAKNDVKGFYQNSITDGINYFKADGKTVADPDEVKSLFASIDIIFLNGTSSTQYKEENLINNEITVKTLPNDYIVHPAFQRIGDSVVNNDDGNWASDLTGIWVAKFEASRSDATIAEQGIATTIKSVPSVKSVTELKIGEAYDYALEMYPILYSHMMKSSEWGATAYLAYSAYGRNGYEVSANKCSTYVTGGGGASGVYSPSENKFKNEYAYDTTAGMQASTTGNIYGVYDLAGGVSEYVATYLLNASANITNNAKTLTDTTMPYMREAYNAGNPEGPLNNYNKNGVADNVYGNAIYETSTGYSGNFAIFSDTSKYPSGNKPFFIRGGDARDGAGAGIFSFEEADGAPSEAIGFRPVLAFR